MSDTVSVLFIGSVERFDLFRSYCDQHAPFTLRRSSELRLDELSNDIPNALVVIDPTPPLESLFTKTILEFIRDQRILVFGEGKSSAQIDIPTRFFVDIEPSSDLALAKQILDNTAPYLLESSVNQLREWFGKTKEEGDGRRSPWWYGKFKGTEEHKEASEEIFRRAMRDAGSELKSLKERIISGGSRTNVIDFLKLAYFCINSRVLSLEIEKGESFHAQIVPVVLFILFTEIFYRHYEIAQLATLDGYIKISFENGQFAADSSFSEISGITRILTFSGAELVESDTAGATLTVRSSDT